MNIHIDGSKLNNIGILLIRVMLGLVFVKLSARGLNVPLTFCYYGPTDLQPLVYPGNKLPHALLKHPPVAQNALLL